MPTYSSTEYQKLYQDADGYFQQASAWFAQLSLYLDPKNFSEYHSGIHPGGFRGDASRLGVSKHLASKEGLVAARRISDAIREETLPPGRSAFEVEMDDFYVPQLHAAIQAFLIQQGADPTKPEFSQLVKQAVMDAESRHYEYRTAIRKTLNDKLIRRGGFDLKLGELIHSMVVYGSCAWRQIWRVKQREMIVHPLSLSRIRIPNVEAVFGAPVIFELIKDTPKRINESFSWLVDEKGKPLVDLPIDATQSHKIEEFILAQYHHTTNVGEGPDRYEYTLYKKSNFSNTLAEFELPLPMIHFAAGMSNSGQVYGEGLGELILGDTQVADQIKRDMLRAAKWKADPAFLIHKDLYKHRSLVQPGQKFPMPSGVMQNPPVQGIDMGGDVGTALAAMQKISEGIKVASAYMPGTTEAPTNVTLGQWESHEEVDVRSRAAIENAVERGILKPVVETAYALMRGTGHIQAATAHLSAQTPPELNGGELAIRFTGYDQATNRRRNVARMGQMLMSAQTYEQNPALQQWLPRDKFYPYMARQLGIEPEAINTTEEAREYMARMQAAIKEQQDLQTPPAQETQ